MRKDAQQWKRREQALFNKVDLVLYPSEVEVSEVRTVCDHVRAIPLNIYPDIQSSSSPGGRTGLLFVGGFLHPSNADALIWFVSKVLPIINTKRPDIILHVVGSNADDRINALASNNVAVIGSVSDSQLSELYDSVKVSVVPLRYGAGVKGKVVEAMYKGVPVVTTGIGAEGLPQGDGYLLCKDGADEFAAAVLSLYDDDHLWQQISDSAHGVIREHFSRDAAINALAEFFEPLEKGANN